MDEVSDVLDNEMLGISPASGNDQCSFDDAQLVRRTYARNAGDAQGELRLLAFKGLRGRKTIYKSSRGLGGPIHYCTQYPTLHAVRSLIGGVS